MADRRPLTADQQAVIDGFEAGDMGAVEFTEMALEAGLSLERINKALEEQED